MPWNKSAFTIEGWLNPEIRIFDASLRSSAFTQQIDNLYNINFLAMLEFLVLIVLTSYLLNKIDAQPLHIAIWASITTFTVLLRLFARRDYKTNSASRSSSKWAIQSIVLMTLISTCWASIPAFFLDPENLISVAMITGLVMGIGAGAVVSAMYPPSFLAVLLPIFLAMLYRCFSSGDTNSAVFLCGLIVLAGFLAYPIVAYRVYVNTMNSIRMQLVNEQLQKNAELKSAFLETVLNSIQQGLLISDASGNVQQVNHRFRHLLDLKNDIKHIDEIDEFSTLDTDQSEFETPLFHLVADRVSLPDGGHVITVTDVSESRSRENDLQRAKQEAELANAAKTRFLATASHDLRQPVHALGMYFESLESRVKTSDAAPLMVRVRDSINVVDEMLNSLLDVSRLDAGVVDPDFQAVSVDSCLKKIALENQGLADSLNIQIEVDCPPCRIVSDVAMLDRIVRNLVSNAIKASPGGVVQLSASVHDDEVVICVTDNGTGIDADHINHVFQEFYQVHNPHRDHRQGLGLGLAIVSGLCSLLNHSVNVTSTPGSGSQFSIRAKKTLATATASTQPSIATLLDDSTNLGDKKIVIIDDDSAVLDSMKRLFIDWGMQTLTVETVPEAIAAIGDQTPDLVISDYRLRDNLTGFEAIAQLKRALGCEFPVIMITGDTAPERLIEARQSAMPVLYKPVRPGQLKTAVRRVLLTGNLQSRDAGAGESADTRVGEIVPGEITAEQQGASRR